MQADPETPPWSGPPTSASSGTAIAAATEPPSEGLPAYPIPLGPVVGAVRVLCGLLWLQNVGWKVPPDFAGLERFVALGVEEPTLPGFSSLLDRVVQPNIELFGWIVLLTELALAAALLSGLATRLFGLLGAVQGLLIGLTVATAEGEWGWSYWMIVAAHLALLATAAGRWGGLDGILRPRLAGSPSAPARVYLRWLS